MSEEEGEGVSASLFPGNDLALELMREHTLLSVMSARMRESADGLERGTPVDRARVERALEVHRRYLIEVHHEHERRVDAALAGTQDAAAKELLAECAREHPRAALFQTAARATLTVGKAGEIDPAALARSIRAEAERIDEHHGREDEVYRRLDKLLPSTERSRLLDAIRRFDASHVSAEIALIAWAAQIHPSAD